MLIVSRALRTRRKGMCAAAILIEGQKEVREEWETRH